MSDVEQIELSMSQAKKLIERKDTLNRLFEHKDFKALIVEEYFNDEAVRLVHMMSDQSMAEYREQIIKNMDGISTLREWFRVVKQMGEAAENELAEAQEEYIEALAEENMGEEV